MESIAKFKTELRKQKDNRQVPKHFEIGPRKLNIAGVCGCSFGEPLNQETFQTSLYIQTRV
jgi:hypothetical protein